MKPAYANTTPEREPLIDYRRCPARWKIPKIDLFFTLGINLNDKISTRLDFSRMKAEMIWISFNFLRTIPRHLLCLVVIVFQLLAFQSTADAEGVDTILERPGSKKTWGGFLADVVGYQGFSKSYALVIGISSYEDGYRSLPTAKDAKRMADYLFKEANFDHVHLLTEEKVTKRRVAELMNDVFPELLDENDRFLFYWSGHGDTRDVAIGDGDAGYLPLSDTPPRQWSGMVAMADVQRWHQFIRARQSLYLLDACFGGLAGIESKALTPRDHQIDQLAQSGHHVMSAGTEEEEVIAGDRWGGSLFTTAVIDGLRGEADAASGFPRDGIISLTELKSYVQTRVLHERLEANWSKKITPQVRDLRYNAGEFFFLASKPHQAPITPNDNNGGAIAKAPLESFRDCDGCPEMVVIPGASFMMGSPPDEKGRSPDEGPLHAVIVPSFAIGKHEVTFDQWDACVRAGDCINQPSDEGWGRGDRPVINVSWNDAQDYVAWLIRKTGYRYRLPTESEWEFAARGNAQTRFFWGDRLDRACAYANGHDESSSSKNKFAWEALPCDDRHPQTAAVGSLNANDFGLHDIIGNVWEWVEDSYHDSYNGAPSDGSAWMSGDRSARVLRGGSWNYVSQALRSAKRDWDEPDFRGNVVGFRVARDLEP